jgi:hypothetical protein
MDSFKEIIELMKNVHELASKHGIFIEDRELIKCTNCGLMEDVDCSGVLIVYKEEDLNKRLSYYGTPHDTGLRFKALNEDNLIFECPLCKIENEPEKSEM